MADFHAADLWVAVVPETSQVGPAMEKAGKEAKGKFGDAVKGIGKNIHDEFDKIGAKAKESFGKAGKTAGEVFSSEIGRELTNSAAKEIGSALSDAVKDLPAVQRGVELFQQWGSAAKSATGGIQGVSDAIHSAKIGDFNGALNGVERTLRNLEPVAKTFGVDISGWEGPLGDVQQKSKTLTDTYGDLKGNIEGTAKGFAGLTNDSGRIAGGLNAIAAAAGPLAATFAALDTLMPGFDQHLNNVLGQIQGKQGFNAKDWFNTLIPGTNLLDRAFGWDKKPPASTSGPGWAFNPSVPGNLLNPFTRANQDPDRRSTPNTSSPWANSPWFGHGSSAAPAPAAPSPSVSVPDMPIPSSGSGSGFSGSSLTTPSVSSRADLRAAGGKVGNLLAFAKSLEGTPYSQALRNDCSGMVAKIANVALGLPPEASFSTVNEGSWLFSHGFEPGLGGPNDLNIGWYDHGGGNNGHTAATLPGGIHAESGGSHGSFLLGPGAAGAENSEFTQHAHLRMGNFRASSAAGVGPVPVGTEHDPIYVTQSTSGAGGTSGSSPFQSQGQQLGQGLVNGLLQMVGLDGSVMGGKSPLDWGAVKLGGGILNWGLGTMRSMANGPMGTPGMSSGGGGGLLAGLGGLIPQPGPMVSAAAGPAGGSYGVKTAVGNAPTSVTHDNSINIHGSFKDSADMIQRQQWEQHSRSGRGSGLPMPA